MKPDSLASVPSSSYTDLEVSTGKSARISNSSSSDVLASQLSASANPAKAVNNIAAAAELVLQLKKLFSTSPIQAGSSFTNLDPSTVSTLVAA